MSLTEEEFNVLVLLVRRAGQLVTNPARWTRASGKALVRRLCERIELDPVHPRHIMAEPWIGCRFVAD